MLDPSVRREIQVLSTPLLHPAGVSLPKKPAEQDQAPQFADKAIELPD